MKVAWLEKCIDLVGSLRLMLYLVTILVAEVMGRVVVVVRPALMKITFMHVRQDLQA